MSTKFNINDHRDFVFKLITERKLHYIHDEEELYQDFCLYFYEKLEFYKFDEYAVTTIIATAFKNYLSKKYRAKQYKNQGQAEVHSLGDKPEEFLDNIQGEELGELTPLELGILVEELCEDADDTTMRWLVGSDKDLFDNRDVQEKMAQEEGITRQAISKRVRVSLAQMKAKLN